MRTKFLPLLCHGLLLAAIGANRLNAATVQVYNSNIVGVVNWYATNEYVLNSFVFVETNEVLNIEAGTVIKGQTNTTAANIAALVVARGGKIVAQGTAANPIIFTSILDDLSDTLDLGIYQRGLWGGVVLLGKGRINTASNAGGNASNPKYDVYEGLPDTENFRYGGNDDDDNSGVLRYVSIRHGGKVLESNKEINGLSMGAVGRGTVLDHIECYAIADDGYEWFGGAVNSKYLISAFNDDDCFDNDQGYRGKNQFWFAIQESGARDKGMEVNGEPNGLAVGVPPVATWEAYNVTLIGAGAGSGGSGNNTFNVRDYASPSIYNSIFTDYAQRGLAIDATAGSSLTNGTLHFANNIWYGFTGGADPNSATNVAITPQALPLFTDASFSNLIVNPQLNGIGRSNNGMLDPRPGAGSPALTGARPTPNDGFYMAASYQGAFDPNAPLWFDGWTALSAYGIGLSSPPTITKQPSGHSDSAGASVTFSVEAAGTAPLLYQWFKGAGIMAGQTGPTLTLNNIQAGDVATYSVEVSNAVGTTNSVGAPLVIYTPNASGEVNITNTSIVGIANWRSTNTYILNGFVFVETNEVLNIDAGTLIKGQTNTTAANIAALVVARGGKIYANGTPNRPIIFTSILDDVFDALDLGLYQRGLWGGIVLLGKGRINTASNAGGNASNPKYDVYEGLPDVENFRYGGDDDNDDSGVLRYVSIRHGGKVLESNKEINGLSMGAVGRGTKIEFVEAYAIADDGYEWFGGAVNTRYLVSAFNDDDCFDNDQGYRGKNQFWFAIQESGARDKGMEVNGEPNGLAVGVPPVATWEAYNVTLIGAGAGSGGSGNNTFNVRDYASPSIYNSIFTDYAQRGLAIDATAASNLTNGTLHFANNIWYGFTGGADPNSATNVAITPQALPLFTDASQSNLIVNPQLRSISRTSNGALDPRPAPGSPAFAVARPLPNDPFYTPAPYAGAFQANGLWLSGWTALSAYGVITPDGGSRDPNTGQLDPAAIVQVSNADIVGTVNWRRTNTYILNGFVFVETNEVLNIEAGTVIKGQTNTTAANIAALVVARGGKVFADGTAQNPIIFTAAQDDLDDPGDLGLYQRGLWGGVVLLGKGRINTASNAGGNASNPKYDVYEGLPDTENYRYGGDDDDDSSGVLRYVSIRHGGKVLESNKEINGLSMGAVGRGTTIEFVEAYAIADDGYEWFGGAVNTRYLVSAFNDDDCFDNDQGYRGQNQFWFAIQESGARDKGMEVNGEPNGLAVGVPPVATWEAYNVTLIGAGAGSGGSGNNTFNVRDYASPSIYNSIFTDYAQRGLAIDATAGSNLTNGTLHFADNLWYGFTGGDDPNSATNVAITPQALPLFTDPTFRNSIIPPQLTSISRTANNGLDPRPLPSSPAWTGARPVPSGFYQEANYQGAFGTLNWASDWTALGCYAVLTGSGAGSPPTGTNVTQPTAPTLTVSLSGTTLNITFASQTGVTYQLQSATVLVNGATVWTNEGSSVAGTGGSITIPVSTAVGDYKFYRVSAL